MGKQKIASAIGYSPGDPAPALLASGRGREAEQIIAIAEQAGVAVVEDAALAPFWTQARNPAILSRPGAGKRPQKCWFL